MAFNGTDGGGVSYYCKNYNVTMGKTALIIMNLSTSAVSTTPNISQVVSTLYVNGLVSNQSYDVANTTGGFYSSISSSETVGPGNNSIRLCSGYKAVTNLQSTYSVSVLE